MRAAIEARERVPGTPVLILSQYVEESYAGDLLASDEGGVGYLLKDRVADVRQFTESLERVAGGGTAMDPEVVAQLLGRRDNRGPLGELTPRELEVLTLMAEGRSNTGIGAELGISASAIEKHVKQVFMKLDLPPSDERPPPRARRAQVPGELELLVLVAALAGAVVALLGAFPAVIAGVRAQLRGDDHDRDRDDRQRHEDRADQLAAHDRYSPAEPSHVSPSSAKTAEPSSGRKRPAPCHQRTTITFSAAPRAGGRR